MKFEEMLNSKFGSSNGAYSIVTAVENSDSQITLTDYEAEMVVSHFGRGNIHIGNVQSNKPLSSKQFRLFPNGERISLNIVYPKPERTELRLYISSRAGFKPPGGEIWFMFLRDGDIWIGAMPEHEWRRYISSELVEEESYDEIYQSSVNDTDADTVRIATIREHDVYARDRNIAIRRMQLSALECEFDPSHQLFVSRFSQRPYLEAHHLIPIGWQRHFPARPLDNIHNVFCLCPNCHRAVHHAEISHARTILSTLAARRPVLDDFHITIPDLYNIYAVEDIQIDSR